MNWSPFQRGDTSLDAVQPKTSGQVEMRRLILLGLVGAMALPAAGAKRVTVAQLEEALEADNAARRSDMDVAHQIGTLEMSERLTDRALNRFATGMRLGPRTALA